MDCKGKYCNYEDDGGNTESCQKCTDVEKCYKIPVRLKYLSQNKGRLFNLEH